jgi:hypothetical protein
LRSRTYLWIATKFISTCSKNPWSRFVGVEWAS